MNFIYPSFLWALLLILIPIIIHILNLRKHRTVYFSNVNLLKLVRKNTRKRSKIKELLILASRILLIVALVMAFAKPFIPTANVEQQLANNIAGIYIDNSYSMNAEGPEGRAIESAKQKAYAIVNGSRPDTRFILLNNTLDDFQNRFYSHSEMIRLIADTEITHNWIDLSTIQLRFATLMENFLFETNRSIYFISDFQQYTSDFQNFRSDTLISYHFLPVPVNKVANLYVDTCWFDSPTHHLNQLETLNVRVVNSSDDNFYQVPVNYFVNDTLKALSTVDIAAGQQKLVSLQYTNLSAGMQLGRVEITDYPIVYDNTLYLSYEVRSSLNALVVEQRGNETSRNLQAMFRADEYVNLDVERSDRIQISSLQNYSTIFLNELDNVSSGLADELGKYVASGGTLVVIPSATIETEQYSGFLSSIGAPSFSTADTIEVPFSEVPYEHPLFEHVFSDQTQRVELPVIRNRYRFSDTRQFAGSTVFSFADQSLALTLNQWQNGNVYTFAFPVSYSENEFIRHLLFFPTFYNIVLQSAYSQQLYHVIGRDRHFDLQLPGSATAVNYLLRHEQTGNEMIPSIVNQRGNTVRLLIDNDFEAGFYTLVSDAGIERSYAFNYQLKESEFEYYRGAEILRMAQAAGLRYTNLITASNENLRAQIEEIDQGRQLWKIFVLLGLLFLVAEAAIIRFWP